MEKKLKKHTHGSDGKCCQPELLETLSAALKTWKTTEATDSSKKSAKPVNSGDEVARNIEKHILHGSAGVIPPGCEAPGGGLAYPKESKFVFHYRIRKVDDDHTVLDDTRKYGKSMELYSGKEFQLDFWEHCLGTMLPGEVASFLVPPERLLAFPAVNKKLRDYMLDKKGHAVKHCCGLMSLQEQGGLGYPDLDELMMKPEPLEFIFELLRVDVPGSTRKDTWIMNSEEKAELVPTLRKEGNQLYENRDFEAAANKYREALGLLEQLVLREKPGEPEWVALDMARVPLFVNLAQCQFKLKQYYAAIESTSEALSRDPKNVKALYRRSKAYSETWDLDLSAEDLRKVADLMPDMAAAVNVELQALEAKRAEQALKERRLLAGKLSARSPSSPPTNQVQSKPKITN
ncbi:hypothetical protein CRM22_006650 [Opisthorchis felineus]|uniref:AIP/AIPL N-terminal FKBP-type PPIase domain-containing protein n=1 Tax=Opisthorchis felineus TaxID=147828 RepID=A0A4S2LJT4_OPIFE|nr:hypothetical protein CRM22_006650 [Opisthorchis felineus]